MGRVTRGYLDINRYSENTIRDILNILLELKLDNLNFTEYNNFPVIDLGDSDGGICFQVTSGKSSDELRKIVTRFNEKKLNEKYPKLCLFILGGINNNSKTALATAHSQISKEDIYDFSKLISCLENLKPDEIYKIERIRELLDENYFRYTYLKDTLSIYTKAVTDKFSSDFESYVEPYLFEDVFFMNEASDGWGDDKLTKVQIRREYGKITLKEVFRENNQFVVIGNPGTGKSEMLKFIFKSLIGTFNELYSEEPLTPVFITLRDVDSSNKIEDIINHELNKYIPNSQGIDAKIISNNLTKFLLKNNTLCLLIDGYDELESDQFTNWNESLRTFLIHYPNARIIISVRRNRIRNDIHLPIEKHYEILPFENDQLERYIRRIAKEKKVLNEYKIESIVSEIKRSNLSYSEPALIIKMLVDTLLFKGTNYNIPHSKGEIYYQYFEHIVLKKLKDVGINDPKEKLSEQVTALVTESFHILSLIAKNNFKRTESDLGNDFFIVLNEILRGIETKIGYKYLFKKNLSFFVEELQIIKILSDRTVQFNHYTYQEFFFALWLKNRLFMKSTCVLEWIKSAYIVSKYNQVFLFLIGLLSSDEAELFIKKFLSRSISLTLLQAQMLEKITDSKYLFIGEIAHEGLLKEITKKNIVKKIEGYINDKEPLLFYRSYLILSRLSPGSEEIFEKMLSALKRRGHWQHRNGFIQYTLASLNLNKKLINSVEQLLESEDSYLRGTAIEFLATIQFFEDKTIKRVIELGLKKDAYNSNDVLQYMLCLSKVNPNACIDYVEKLKANIEANEATVEEIKLFHDYINYFAGTILNIESYQTQENEARIINVLSDPNSLESRYKLIRSLAKGRIKNKVIIEKLIEILNNDEELSSAAFMYFRDLLIIKPEIIEKAILYLDSVHINTKTRAINYLASIQYSCEIDYNGVRVPLAKKIEDKLYDNAESINTSFNSYSIDYLGGVNYRSNLLEDFLLGKGKDSGLDKVFPDTEVVLRYCMNTKHYSETFFNVVSHYQKIREDYSINSLISDKYFEHLERYVPEDKIQIVKGKLSLFYLSNVLKLFRVLKLLRYDSGIYSWANQQLERFFRTTLALQKIVLYEEERRLMIRLGNRI